MFSTLFRVEWLSMDTFHGNGIYEYPASYSVTPCQCLTCPSSISSNQRRASNAIYVWYIFMYNRYTSFRSARRIKSARGTKQIVLFRVSFVICVALIYIFPFFLTLVSAIDQIRMWIRLGLPTACHTDICLHSS